MEEAYDQISFSYSGYLLVTMVALSLKRSGYDVSLHAGFLYEPTVVQWPQLCCLEPPQAQLSIVREQKRPLMMLDGDFWELNRPFW